VLLLFESRFFHTLKPDALIELGHSATVKIYTRGAKMCQAGDLSDAILLLIDGTADVVVQRGETMQIVGTVNVGETIGEMGFFQ
jgi:signal-transduction protein with cAMP-binding, CBS, and nucleotidyltransferase domain